MNSRSSSYRLPVAAALWLACLSAASAQAPTATRRLHPSAFALANGTFTGLQVNQQAVFVGGRNIAFTLGGDLGVFAPGSYSLALEIRGTYPLIDGILVSEKSALAGLQFSREPPATGLFSSVRPYVDVLFGRGQLNYQRSGYLTQNLIFYQSNSNVLQGGGGVELDVSQHFSLKLDAQLQKWKSPVLPSGTFYSKQGGIGITYRFGAGSGPR